MNVSGLRKTSNHRLQFSVIIPTKNRPVHVQSLVRRLLHQTYPKNAYEIIVIDNDSRNAPYFPPIQSKNPKLIRAIERRTGPSICRNTGLHLAHFKHVLFLDDDIMIPTNFLTLLETAWMQHPHAVAIGGKILPVERLIRSAIVGRQYTDTHQPFFGLQDYGIKPLSIPSIPFLLSSVLSVNIKHRNTPLFDDRLARKYGPFLIGGEDFELTVRLFLEGKNVLYDPSLIAHHNIDSQRLTQRYVNYKYLLTGIDCYFEDTILTERFSGYVACTKSNQLKQAIRNIIHGKQADFFLSLFAPTTMLFLCGYYFVGPILFSFASRLRFRTVHTT